MQSLGMSWLVDLYNHPLPYQKKKNAPAPSFWSKYSRSWRSP